MGRAIQSGAPMYSHFSDQHERWFDKIAWSDFGRRVAPGPKGRGPGWAEQCAEGVFQPIDPYKA